MVFNRSVLDCTEPFLSLSLSFLAFCAFAGAGAVDMNSITTETGCSVRLDELATS